jgi:VanZ family protein
MALAVQNNFGCEYRRWVPKMQHFTFRLSVRMAAWACILAIALLSLLPTEAIVRTSLGGKVEHVVAYLAAALLTAVGYGTGAGVVLGLLAYAGALELLQAFSPGRTSSLVDYLFSAGGVGLGIILAVRLKTLADAWLRPGRHADTPH